MVGTNLKAETMKLMDKRAYLESDMNTIVQRLCQPGGPGLSGNLLDSEGFPRSDMDIPSVRADRHRLSQLKNDHKDLTEKINQNIQLLHAAKPAFKSSTVLESDSKDLSTINATLPAPILSRESPGAMDSDVIVNIPFAMIDEIAEVSPAAEDGLQLGDQIVKFGNVDSGDNLLERLASEVQMNQGVPTTVLVMRQGAQMSFVVTPRPWSGRGLLGCHFRIL